MWIWPWSGIEFSSIARVHSEFSETWIRTSLSSRFRPSLQTIRHSLISLRAPMQWYYRATAWEIFQLTTKYWWTLSKMLSSKVSLLLSQHSAHMVPSLISTQLDGSWLRWDVFWPKIWLASASLQSLHTYLGKATPRSDANYFSKQAFAASWPTQNKSKKGLSLQTTTWC